MFFLGDFGKTTGVLPVTFIFFQVTEPVFFDCFSYFGHKVIKKINIVNCGIFSCHLILFSKLLVEIRPIYSLTGWTGAVYIQPSRVIFKLAFFNINAPDAGPNSSMACFSGGYDAVKSVYPQFNAFK